MSANITSDPPGNVEEEVPDPVVGESIEIPLVEFSQAVSAIIQEAESGGGGGEDYEEITFVKTEQEEDEEQVIEEQIHEDDVGEVIDEMDMIAGVENGGDIENDENDEQKGKNLLEKRIEF